MTTATLFPSAVNGWYVNPTVTLAATDRDGDVDRTEYRLDGAAAWNVYTGPFQVTGDGDRMLEFRSIDKAENTETTKTLSFRIDGTAPAIAGLPGPSCNIWPPNKEMVQVASVTVADGGSGLAPGTFTIGVTGNETLGPGDVVINGGTVMLRATRQGNGNGRTYTINVAVSDRAGNGATASASCTVPHDRGH